VLAAKESWSSAAEGDQHRLGGLDEQFAALAESLTRLFPSGECWPRRCSAPSSRRCAPRQPPPALAMEVATSLLYVEAALEDAAFDQPEQAERVRRLARRVEAVATAGGRAAGRLDGGPVPPRLRPPDPGQRGARTARQPVEIERQCDEYFRSPTQRELLIPVPGQLQAMRGVLSVLGLDQAARHRAHARRDRRPGQHRDRLQPPGRATSSSAWPTTWARWAS
jgi:chemosensory pili system protein ChpA (sensor histidine kinase/response regulator)